MRAQYDGKHNNHQLENIISSFSMRRLMKAADLSWSRPGLPHSFISSEEAEGRKNKNFLFLLIEIRFYAGTKWKGNFVSLASENVVIQFHPENIVSFYLNEFLLSGGTPIKRGKTKISNFVCSVLYLSIFLQN